MLGKVHEMMSSVCCQKVSEAEVFARGGTKGVMVSNQVNESAKIKWLAEA